MCVDMCMCVGGSAASWTSEFGCKKSGAAKAAACTNHADDEFEAATKDNDAARCDQVPRYLLCAHRCVLVYCVLARWPLGR